MKKLLMITLVTLSIISFISCSKIENNLTPTELRLNIIIKNVKEGTFKVTSPYFEKKGNIYNKRGKIIANYKKLMVGEKYTICLATEIKNKLTETAYIMKHTPGRILNIKYRYIQSDLHWYIEGIEGYKTDYDVYPNVKNIEELEKLLIPFYLKEKSPTYWGKLEYRKTKDGFLIGSGGSDNKIDWESKGLWSLDEENLRGKDIIYINGKIISGFVPKQR